MTVQPSMNQQSFQPQPTYTHTMIGQMAGQYGTSYGMTMSTMGPVMGMPSAAREPCGPMNNQSRELSLGSSEPNAISIPNSLPTANINPLPKDQSLEDGKLFLLWTILCQWHACCFYLVMLANFIFFYSKVCYCSFLFEHVCALPCVADCRFFYLILIRTWLVLNPTLNLYFLMYI